MVSEIPAKQLPPELSLHDQKWFVASVRFGINCYSQLLTARRRYSGRFILRRNAL